MKFVTVIINPEQPRTTAAGRLEDFSLSARLHQLIQSTLCARVPCQRRGSTVGGLARCHEGTALGIAGRPQKEKYHGPPNRQGATSSKQNLL